MLFILSLDQISSYSTDLSKGRTSHSELMVSHFSNKRAVRGAQNPRLIIGGGHDLRIEETMMTLVALIANRASLS